MRVMVAVVALAALVISMGLAGAQEQKTEGVMGAIKNIVPGGSDEAAAKKEGEGMLDKMKGMLSGSEKKEGEGLLDKAKSAVSGEKKEGEGLLDKAKSAVSCSDKPATEAEGKGMLDKMKGMLPGGENK